ncbi:ATP-binding protein [Paracidovorax wautersii]|uniref:Chemotaxis protein CheA n=1 Tax=Paracidovorax wautersii TaxID=1177982 RepID=A0A1I2EJH9_9BURK|nr:ATP-binding protein [Paracidovorax wautersii]SFE92843.1 two-component system, chemotaxis family, sensor kinase CheA [Paracidovorax wautersii]
MTVRSRIALLIVLALLALCAIGGFALYQSSQGALQVKRVTEGVVPSTIHSVELMGQLKDVQIAALNMVGAPDRAAAEAMHQQVTERKDALRQALEAQSRSADSEAQRGLIKEAEMSLDNYFAAIDDTAKFKLAGQQEAAEAYMAATVDQYLREQGQMIEAVQVERRRSKDEAIAELNQQLERTTTMLLLVAAVSVIGLGGAGLMLYRQIVQPIGEMQLKMTEIATSQDFSHRVPVARMDEIGRSLTAFNAMVAKIEESSELVRQKTADIQAMLQTLPQGILTLEAGRRIHPEYSSYLCTLLERQQLAGRTLDEALLDRCEGSADARAQADAAIDACIGEDELNFSFNAHLLPKELCLACDDGRRKIIELGWSPITAADGTVARLLVSLRDVTELRELARDAQARKEELSMVGELLAVPAEKFRAFAGAAAQLLDEARVQLQAPQQARASAIAALFRGMHTIKGNARTYGLPRIADAAHVAEQRYSALRDDLSGWDEAALVADLDAVDAALQAYVHVNDETLGRGAAGHEGAEGAVRIARERLDALRASIDSVLLEGDWPQDHRERLAQVAHALQHPDAAGLAEVFGSVAASLPDLARELGKEAPVAECTGTPVLLRAQAGQAMRDAFVHLLRNAVDHGIEPPQERAAKGKPARGHIRAQTQIDGDDVIVRLQDDGRGLDLARIHDRALAQGLLGPDDAPSAEALAQMIFAPGFSTASQVTAVSGRGVGMDAVKAFIEALDGSVAVVLDADAAVYATPFTTVIRLPLRWTVSAQGSRGALGEAA